MQTRTNRITWLLVALMLGTLAFAQTTLTFWAGAKEPGLQKLFEKYEKENPNIQLELEVIPYSNYAQKIVAAARTDTLPDVLLLQPKVPVTMAELGVLEPVTELVSELGGEDEFYSRDLGFNTLDGEIWGIPFYVYPHVLFYRKDALQEAGVEAPKTWGEFKTAAEAVTEDDFYGYVAYFNDPVAHTLHEWMATNNAYTFDEDLNITFDSENTVETLAFIDSLWEAGVIPPGATTYNQSDARVGFVNDLGAMLITSTSFLDTLVSQAPQLVDNIGIAPTPQNKGDATYYAFRSIGLPKGSSDRAEAIKFITWLYQPENLITYFEDTKLGYMPMTKSLQNSDAYWESEAIAPYAHLIRPALEAASKGYMPGLNKQVNAYAGLFETQNVYRGALMDIIVEDMSAEAAVDEAVEKMQAIMER